MPRLPTVAEPGLEEADIAPWATQTHQGVIVMQACSTAQSLLAQGECLCHIVLWPVISRWVRKGCPVGGWGPNAAVESKLSFVVVVDRQSPSQLLRTLLACMTEAVKSQN